MYRTKKNKFSNRKLGKIKSVLLDQFFGCRSDPIRVGSVIDGHLDPDLYRYLKYGFR